MPTTAAQLQTLAGLRANLAELARLTAALREVGAESQSLGEIFSQGLGGGLVLAQRGVEVLCSAFDEAVAVTDSYAAGVDRARLGQEALVGSAEATTQALARLRTEGYDRLRGSADQTGTALGETMTAALTRAQADAEQAARRIGGALTTVSQKLAEAKAGGAPAAAVAAEASTGDIVSSLASSFSGGLAKALEHMEQSGGVAVAFQNFGKLLGSSLGVSIVTAAGEVIIQQLERWALENHARIDAFRETAFQTSHQIQKALPQVSSAEELRGLYNTAATRQREAAIARDKLLGTGGRSAEENAQIEALNGEIEALSKLIPLIKTKGAEYLKANSAATTTAVTITGYQTQLAVLEIAHTADQASSIYTVEEKLAKEQAYYAEKIKWLKQIRDLEIAQPLPAEKDANDAALKRAARDKEIALLDAQIMALSRTSDNTFHPTSAIAQKRRQLSTFESGRDEKGAVRLTPGDGLAAGAIDSVMKLGTVGEQIAATFSGTVSQGISSVSQGITGLIEGTARWGDIGRSVVHLLLQNLVQLGVQLAVQSALEVGIHAAAEASKTSTTFISATTRHGIYTTETAAQVSHAATRTAAHTVSEGVQTGATATGAGARSGIRLGETLMHGVQVALRTAAHLAGEVLQTGVTIVQSGLRIASAIAESAASLVKAALGAMSAMASIPYVGPILAIAAMAAIIAAGGALLKGHAEGGYTGDGGKYELAGTVHRGEVVFSQADVSRMGGVGAVENLRLGGISALNELSLSRSQPGVGSGLGGGSSSSSGSSAPLLTPRPGRDILVVGDLFTARSLARDPEFDSHIISAVQRNRGDLFDT